MRVFSVTAAVVALVVSAFSSSAASDSALRYVATNLNVLMGPGPHYPTIAFFATGSQATMVSCTDDFTWCDDFT